MNGDGRTDLIFAGTRLQVVMNRDHGRMDPTESWILPFRATVVAVHDFNGDGFDDVFVASNEGSGMILYSSAETVWDDFAFVWPGLGVVGCVAGDVNDDGHADICLTGATGAVARVLLNDGTGHFLQPVEYPVPPVPNLIFLQSLDGDADPDLVVRCTDKNRTIVLLNAGDGTFVPGSEAAGPVLDVGDVTGDGLADLIVLTSAHALQVHENAGNATFSLKTTYALPIDPYSLEIVDFDRDGLGDIVAMFGSDELLRLRNVGGGTFEQAEVFIGCDSLNSIATCDIDGVQGPDLVLLGSYGRWLALLNDGSGRLRSYAESRVTYRPRWITPIDANGDELTDIVVSDTSENRVEVLLNIGAGVLERSLTLPILSHPAGHGTIDLDEDGDTDLLVAAESTLEVLLNDGHGTFAKSESITLSTERDTMCEVVALADIDSDGDTDCVVSNIGRNKVHVLVNLGTGSFAPPVNYSIETGNVARNACGLVLTDINADARPDIVVIARSGADVSVLLNLGNGSFAPVTHPPAPFMTATRATSGDVDRDGDADIVVTEWSTGRVTIIWNDQNGLLNRVTRLDFPGLPEGVALGDVDNNGYPDVLATSAFDNTVVVFKNFGATEWCDPSEHLVAAYPLGVTSTDLDGDGWQDLAVASFSYCSVSVLMNKGSIRPIPLCPADIDGDAFIDAGDFNILAAHFAQAVEPGAPGDLNGDGLVNVSDFAILAANFGRACP